MVPPRTPATSEQVPYSSITKNSYQDNSQASETSLIFTQLQIEQWCQI